MHVITTPKDLEDTCRLLSEAEFITVDTEFIRDSTYWPKLCLLQVAGPEGAHAIDPLAPDMNLAPLYKLFTNDRITKVFHAARQDIEIFYHDTGIIPAPLFDTQVAAMACGFGDSIAYEGLVKSLAKVELDKSQRFTDWSRRPLTDGQIEYALGDVIHLRTIYEKLREQLASKKREVWLQEEMEVLSNPDTYKLEPKDAWKRLKLRSSARRHLGVLMEVAAWREQQAQKQNVPRNRILKDDAIHEIVTQRPTSQQELKRLRLVAKNLAQSSRGESLIQAVKRGQQISKDALPVLAPPRISSQRNGSLVDLLKVLLKLQCEQHGVAQKLVANVQDLEAIAAKEAAQVPAMSGWRYDIFGELAGKLKHREIAIGMDKKGITVIPIKAFSGKVDPVFRPETR